MHNSFAFPETSNYFKICLKLIINGCFVILHEGKNLRLNIRSIIYLSFYIMLCKS